MRAPLAIGIPRWLTNIPYGPLWHAFLSRLGFTVRESTRGQESDGGRGRRW